ncbi:endo-1,4-beta-xylanase [Micromonospora fulviviridis]|uniref:Beta-xylanase n=1 Tax=Micromonospora fulviviridis TaxID=47860 RepID=A0ABV2VL46_9ACTN
MAEDVRGGTLCASGPAAPDPARFRVLPLRPPTGRRRWIALAVLLLLLTVVAVSWVDTGGGGGGRPSSAAWQTPAGPDRPTLRGAAPSNVRIGTAVDSRLLETDPRYRSTLAADFNAVTPEYVMKWAALEPTPGRYDWEAADRLVAFAEANGQAVYGHALVWHSSVPAWVSESWSPARLREVLHKHITTVVSRYRGKVWAWDVVNEALAENGSLRQSIWLRKLGPGYLADAFRWAHEADPDARLFINDYGTEGRTKKADALWRLVRQLRSQGVPVQGVGFQSHLRADQDPTDIAGNLRRFGALGVAVAVTELDVRLQLPATPEKLVGQALLYQHVLEACLAVPTCESFTLWGFTDASSWVTYHYPGYGAACVFDTDLKPKPAHASLIAELRERRSAPPG